MVVELAPITGWPSFSSPGKSSSHPLLAGSPDSRMRSSNISTRKTESSRRFLADKKFVILDRDSKYSAAFRDLVTCSEVEIVRLPPRSPNLNAYAERFVRSIKGECLNRMIFFGERSLR